MIYSAGPEIWAVAAVKLPRENVVSQVHATLWAKTHNPNARFHYVFDLEQNMFIWKFEYDQDALLFKLKFC